MNATEPAAGDESRTPPWARQLDRVRWIGPGIVVAATAIGASHLILAPTAGAAFGYGLLWLILFSHLFKYPAFEFGPRYAVATGRSLLEGYARVPGPSGWALRVFLVGTVIQGISVLAGVLGVSAAVAAAMIPELSIPVWSLLLGLAVVWILRAGGFDGLSALSKLMLGVLAVLTAVAFFATPPPAGAWSSLLVPAAPAGSLVLIAAILGWMPTGIDVSVWHSMWALERRSAWDERAASRPDASGRGALKVGLADMRLGYGLSFALAIMFLTLGAEVLAPAGRVPEGADVAITIARLYTEALGSWTLPIFLTAAFFGMFSTTCGVMDGFSRAFAETVSLLREEAPSDANRAPATPDASSVTAPGSRESDGHALYWSFMAVTFVLALLETWLLPDPVVLVTVAAVASFLLAPVTFALNYWCVTRQIPDPRHRPGRLLRGWAFAGIVFAAAAAVLFIAVHV